MKNYYDRCIKCGKCRNNCVFLKKYNLDFSDQIALKEVAYGCILCGKCSAVCPVGIDGREEILHIREDIIRENKGKLPHKGYGMLLFEKKNYIFRNIRHAKKDMVYFPGCSFPSYFPKTNKLLIEIFRENDIGLFFDCCGKPIYELGLKNELTMITERLENNFKRLGIKKVIVACPNCFHFMRENSNIEIITAFKALKDIGLGSSIDETMEIIFPPCSDRKNREIYDDLRHFLSKDLDFIYEVQCCGLGGVSFVAEPDNTSKLAGGLKNLKYKNILTYCASCTSIFTRNNPNLNISHALPEILGTKERPDYKKGFINRIRAKMQ